MYGITQVVNQMPWMEWVASSSFSFAEGSDDPDELFEKTQALGHAGFGLADRMGIYGWVRAYRAVKSHPGSFYAPGIRLHFDHAEPVCIYALHRAAHAELMKFLSAWALAGAEHAEKGIGPIAWKHFFEFLQTRSRASSLHTQYVLIWLPGRFYPWPDTEHSRVRVGELLRIGPSFSFDPLRDNAIPHSLLQLASVCGKSADSALSLSYPLILGPGLEELREWIAASSHSLSIPILATTLPLFSEESDQAFADVLTCIRFRKTVEQLGYLAQPNGERSLLTFARLVEWQRRLAGKPFLNCPFARSLELKARHHFSLSELSYTYPKEAVPEGETASTYLEKIAFAGLVKRYPEGANAEIVEQLGKELALIAELGYEDYFLTIWDILSYAREQKILFQGRGSAANSVLCYVLGITAVNPATFELLFERFLSRERNEPPDIDVDFEHERREEVFQEVYRRYGRNRAAMVNTVICFKSKMAFRETATAFGMSKESITKYLPFLHLGLLKGEIENKDHVARLEVFISEDKISKSRWNLICTLARRLKGRPRHVGIHTGGFVLGNEDLSEQCVLEPARMQNRSVIPWNKDDIEVLRWMKADLLSLGMLTAIRKSFEYLGAKNNLKPAQEIKLYSIPQGDKKVYRDICAADTVGLFQIESRAQMSMLPRLRPQNFYDLVVEVAIVRPGPIQGGMVHPYLKRRQGLEPVVYDHPSLEPILHKTLGVPIFQEQVMKVAMVAADFSAGEADQLRKVMSGAWRSKSQMKTLEQKLLSRMTAKGIPPDLCQRIYRQIEGFGDYGFPESHAASFAHLTYVSAWLKTHHPAEFVCALLNSQPMGFYSSRTLIDDAIRHGVRVLPVSVFSSKWDSTLEDNPLCVDKPRVRLGMRLVHDLSKKDAGVVLRLQSQGLLSEERELKLRYQDFVAQGMSDNAIRALIAAGALSNRSDEDRRQSLWRYLQEKQNPSAMLAATPNQQSSVAIRERSKWEAMAKDYQAVGWSKRGHPAEHLRSMVQIPAGRRFILARELPTYPNQKQICFLGALTIKQKPPTAGGVVFLTLEDESGFFNLILGPKVYDRYRFLIEEHSFFWGLGILEKSNPEASDLQPSAINIKVTHLEGVGDDVGGREYQVTPRSFH